MLSRLYEKGADPVAKDRGGGRKAHGLPAEGFERNRLLEEGIKVNEADR